MRSFIPLLLLALSQVAFIQAAYTVVDPSDYNSNPRIQDALNFGGEHIIQLGVNRSVLPEDEYQISNISQIQQNLLANGVNYRFNVNIVSDEGVKVAAVYAVYYRYATSALKVTSYQYNYTFPNSHNSTQEFSWEDYEFDTEEEQPGEVELPTEEIETPVEVELPTEEIETPVEVELPTEEVEVPIEEGEVPSGEDGEGEGEGEGEVPNGEDGEEWVCEEEQEEEVVIVPPTEEEVVIVPPTEEEVVEVPVEEWPTEWVEVIEGEQGETEFVILN